jgi:general secretion pathway protein G
MSTHSPLRPPFSRGFTLIELLVTMAIIALLLSLAAPRYFSSIDKAKETVLRENLHQIRDAIDKFHADRGRYPLSLGDLVTEKYLRKLPLDPVSDSENSWITVPPSDPQKGGVYDVKSGAPGVSRDGSAYESW